MNQERLKEKLLELIQLKRKEMIEAANEDGYTGKLTIKFSQELDGLLNDYDQLLKDNDVSRLRNFDYFYPLIWTSGP
jgi:stage 0 sporulation regulatory protein